MTAVVILISFRRVRGGRDRSLDRLDGVTVNGVGARPLVIVATGMVDITGTLAVTSTADRPDRGRRRSSRVQPPRPARHRQRGRCRWRRRIRSSISEASDSSGRDINGADNGTASIAGRSGSDPDDTRGRLRRRRRSIGVISTTGGTGGAPGGALAVYADSIRDRGSGRRVGILGVAVAPRSSGGGGGGSGGMIVLEAASALFNITGFVLAQGGGGGEGWRAERGGADGTTVTTVEPPLGGGINKGGNGGTGAYQEKIATDGRIPNAGDVGRRWRWWWWRRRRDDRADAGGVVQQRVARTRDDRHGVIRAHNANAVTPLSPIMPAISQFHRAPIVSSLPAWLG